jgi:CheY-like chemotaxis protein
MNRIKKLFLVEDDIDDQLFFTDAVSEINNAALVAVTNNGREALDRLKNSPKLPDIIFMDINMPVMNGIDCLKEIVKNPAIKNIPVVILSTSGSEIELVRKVGARAFIKKPSDQAILRTTLEEVINLDFIGGLGIANQTFQTPLSVF